jgi:hypothetical protein
LLAIAVPSRRARSLAQADLLLDAAAQPAAHIEDERFVSRGYSTIQSYLHYFGFAR